MHPDRLREIKEHGPGEDEEAKRQQELAMYTIKVPSANTEPLGSRHVLSAQAAPRGCSTTSPPRTLEAAFTDEVEQTKREDSFDFGRGDALPRYQAGRLIPSPRWKGHQFDSSRRILLESAYQARQEKVMNLGALSSIMLTFSTQRILFKSLDYVRDSELLRYLEHRRLSPSFLREIDSFLYTHPQIADFAPDFVQQFNGARPLAAYRLFLKGFTKPARYIDGILPTTDDELRARIPPVLPSVVAYVDDELVDFFDGYDYRSDILRKIDDEVFRLVELLRSAQQLTPPQRRLLALGLFGNPSDAFKYYEYNYQNDWLPHRYLPEHVILLEVPDGHSTRPLPVVDTYECVNNAWTLSY